MTPATSGPSTGWRRSRESSASPNGGHIVASPLISTSPPALALGAAFVIWVGGEVALQVRSRRAAAPSSGDRHSMPILIASVWAAVALGLWLSLASTRYRLPLAPGPAELAGAAAMVAGVALRGWAIATLGRQFTVRISTEPAHSLVTEGPYRWLRHPGYLGSLITVLGALVAFDSWPGLALLALPGAASAWRIAVEEAALRRHFGSAYDLYSGARKRLIPGLF